eukprot:TRINITY_DN2996_c0_g1_i1.p1 TRINITY_DN2996_c0_g1~~TRINITY_DN2996_c0_g1_i1.p1  ORF type:complete len:170 (+),score=65.71 TRINITY_DN2996_c0_g1_i1:76-585(+)
MEPEDKTDNIFTSKTNEQEERNLPTNLPSNFSSTPNNQEEEVSNKIKENKGDEKDEESENKNNSPKNKRKTEEILFSSSKSGECEDLIKKFKIAEEEEEKKQLKTIISFIESYRSSKFVHESKETRGKKRKSRGKEEEPNWSIFEKSFFSDSKENVQQEFCRFRRFRRR